LEGLQNSGRGAPRVAEGIANRGGTDSRVGPGWPEEGVSWRF
jgi:hypothetical protein